MDALILVDIQNDFMPKGALPVPDGDAVVPIANSLINRFDLVVATQDWHPRDHGSFASNHADQTPGNLIELDGLQQVLWPDHCVQGSPGAQFVDALDAAGITAIFQKGTDPMIDSYSGFFDNGRRKATGLAEFLHEQGADTVYVLGLATDYCVKWTALDAVSEGFQTVLIEDGCRGVNLEPGDTDAALAEMRDAGVKFVNSEELR